MKALTKRSRKAGSTASGARRGTMLTADSRISASVDSSAFSSRLGTHGGGVSVAIVAARAVEITRPVVGSTVTGRLTLVIAMPSACTQKTPTLGLVCVSSGASGSR